MTLSPKAKEYVKSSLITFATAFLIATVPFLGNADWSQSAIIAVLITGVRAGVKALVEMLVSFLNQMKSTMAGISDDEI